MSTVPKIVRERLQAGESAGNHPDANLLTAFAERSLASRERETVLTHLARCRDCRDVVALGLPDAEVVSPAVVVPHRGWLTWPALRWGLVAAGIVVVASFGVMQFQRREQADRFSAKLEAPQAPPPSTEPQAVTPSAPPADARSREKVLESKQTNALTAPAPLQFDKITTGAAPVAATGAAVGGLVRQQYPGGPKAPAFQQNVQNNSQNYAQNGFSPSAANSLNGQEEKDLKLDQARSPSPPAPATTLTVNSAQPAPALPQASTIYKAKAPVTVEASAENADVLADSTKPQELPKQSGYGVNGRNFAQLAQLSGPSAPRWTITPTGGLQRSVDQGNSWQDVDVTVAGVSGGVGMARAAKVATDDRMHDSENNKALKRQATAPAFRAVTAMGAEVWAGGVGGMLYHSQDGGAHWTRVTPSSDRNVLTGDVLSLDFSDLQHGKVTTSIPEIWTTSDSGQTWQRQ